MSNYKLSIRELSWKVNLWRWMEPTPFHVTVPINSTPSFLIHWSKESLRKHYNYSEGNLPIKCTLNSPKVLVSTRSRYGWQGEGVQGISIRAWSLDDHFGWFRSLPRCPSIHNIKLGHLNSIEEGLEESFHNKNASQRASFCSHLQCGTWNTTCHCQRRTLDSLYLKHEPLLSIRGDEKR